MLVLRPVSKGLLNKVINFSRIARFLFFAYTLMRIKYIFDEIFRHLAANYPVDTVTKLNIFNINVQGNF